MRFLVACRDANVRVIAAEGLNIVNGHREPEMTAILDLGDMDDGPGPIDEAKVFVRAVSRPGLYLEFALARL